MRTGALMKVDVVDNGGQWTHREWRVLRYLGVESDIISNTTSLDDIKADGLVLSGGAPTISDNSMKLGNTDEYIEIGIPVLGICVGAQYIARHFGGTASAADNPEYGKTIIHVKEENDIFLGMPKKFIAWESHNDEIKELGSELKLLASSDTCYVQGFKHRTKSIYGLQFHPEVEHTEYGSDMFKNFLKVCEDDF